MFFVLLVDNWIEGNNQREKSGYIKMVKPTYLPSSLFFKVSFISNGYYLLLRVEEADNNGKQEKKKLNRRQVKASRFGNNTNIRQKKKKNGSIRMEEVNGRQPNI